MTSLAIEWDLIVTVFALLRGGRNERAVAMLFVVSNLAALAVKGEPLSPARTLHAEIVHISVFFVTLWLAWRRRTPWLQVLVVVQAVSAVAYLSSFASLPIGRDLRALVFLGRATCLAFGVWRCWLGAPNAAPGPGETDIDLYDAALSRWPRFVRAHAAPGGGP